MGHRSQSPEVHSLVDLNCDPGLTAERQVESRKAIYDLCGPAAPLVLRACAQAAAARRELIEVRSRLAHLERGAQLRGIVIGIHNGRVRLLVGGTERVLERPADLVLGIGQTVLTDADGRSVVGAGDYLVGGQTYAFCEPLEGRHALVRSLREGPLDEARQLALVADCVDLGALAPDDRLLGWSIDQGNIVLVTRRLGPRQPAFSDDTGVARPVRRADIVGFDDIIERVEMLFLDAPNPAYEPMLRAASKALVGVLFSGVPGSGKSLVAQHCITLVRARGGRALYRTASHYLSKWVGEGAASMRADFALLDVSFAETGVRPLIVIDELEAVALDRRHPWALNVGALHEGTPLLRARGAVASDQPHARVHARARARHGVAMAPDRGSRPVGNADAAGWTMTLDGHPLVPVFVKDATFEPPAAEAYFLLAADGLYFVRETLFFSACVRTQGGVPGLRAHAPSLDLKLPRMPAALLERAVGFFREVHVRWGGEAILLMFYSRPPAIGRLGSPSRHHRRSSAAASCTGDSALTSRSTTAPARGQARTSLSSGRSTRTVTQGRHTAPSTSTTSSSRPACT